MQPLIPALVLAALAMSALAGCSRKPAQDAAASGGGADTQLPCGARTYRVSADRIDAELSGACERARQTEDALQSYRATLTRFTCQEGDGHVVSSIFVPRGQYDDYDRICRELLAAGSGARQSALKDYIAATNVLTKKHLDDDNALFRRRQADQAAVSALVRSRGGSIEIK